MHSNEKHHVDLEGEDREHLVSVINDSLRVMTQPHFFSWCQGSVQRLLPHEILVCGISAGDDAPMRCYRYYSSRYFSEEHFTGVCHPVEGLLPRMIAYSNQTGHACMLGTGVPQNYYDEALLPLLARSELRNVAADGQRGSDGRLKSYFCFSRISIPLGPRVEHLLKLLVPYLDATLSRVIANGESEAGMDSSRIMPAVSAREIQILNFIRVGKTNKQIAEELRLSPLTVKNHVQNTLKKLKATTRAHAVDRATNLGLLKSQ